MKLSAVAFRSIAWAAQRVQRVAAVLRGLSRADARSSEVPTTVLSRVRVLTGLLRVRSRYCDLWCVLDTRETGHGELYNNSIHEAYRIPTKIHYIRGLSPPT